MRCKTCHYSLAGLTEHRCPECGNEFDPNDPSTLASEPKPLEVWDWPVLATIYAVIAVVIFFIIRTREGDWTLAAQLAVAAFSSMFWTLFIAIVVSAFKRRAK